MTKRLDGLTGEDTKAYFIEEFKKHNSLLVMLRSIPTEIVLR